MRDELQLGEQGALSAQDWQELLGGEHEPFGPVASRLEWRPKDRHVTLRSADGRLVAAAGALVANVRAHSRTAFPVVGVGSVAVNRAFRGQGLVARMVDPLLDLAATMGPERAMLFCRPQLTALYRRFGFDEVAGPVSVEQPAGRIEMPLTTMWRPLAPGAGWPDGGVEVDGLPF